MIITLSDSDPRPIYKQICDQVLRGRALGTIQPDECLPSIRQLASELRVNPNTVKQGLPGARARRSGLCATGSGNVSGTTRGRSQRTCGNFRAIARRAVEDAERSGLSPEDLIQAIRDLPEPEATGEPAEVEGGGDEVDNTQ